MIAISIFQWGFAKWTRKRKYKNRLKYLYQLTSEEKKLLKSFIDGNTKTRQLSIMSGVVKGLEYAGVIYRSTEMGCASGAAFDYNMQPWAWHYLNDNREILND
jgi:predicted transcriptional regulator